MMGVGAGRGLIYLFVYCRYRARATLGWSRTRPVEDLWSRLRPATQASHPPERSFPSEAQLLQPKAPLFPPFHPVSTTSDVKAPNATPWGRPKCVRPRPRRASPQPPSAPRAPRRHSPYARGGTWLCRAANGSGILSRVPEMSFLPPPGGPMAVTSSTSTMSSLVVSFLSNQ